MAARGSQVWNGLQSVWRRASARRNPPAPVVVKTRGGAALAGARHEAGLSETRDEAGLSLTRDGAAAAAWPRPYAMRPAARRRTFAAAAGGA